MSAAIGMQSAAAIPSAPSEVPIKDLPDLYQRSVGSLSSDSHKSPRTHVRLKTSHICACNPCNRVYKGSRGVNSGTVGSQSRADRPCWPRQRDEPITDTRSTGFGPAPDRSILRLHTICSLGFWGVFWGFFGSGWLWSKDEGPSQLSKSSLRCLPPHPWKRSELACGVI